MEENNEKEIKINIPEGYVIDEDRSTFRCIKFKKKYRFADYDGSYNINGFYIRSSEIYTLNSNIDCDGNYQSNKDVFATKGAAKSALAFAQITQIRANEPHKYGNKPIYKNANVYRIEYGVTKDLQIVNRMSPHTRLESYLSFDTLEHAELFLKENTQLVKEYFMMD